MNDKTDSQNPALPAMSFPRPRQPQTLLLASHERAALHVGLITVAAARLDAWLTPLIAILENSEDPRPELVAGGRASEKVNKLRSLIPAEWVDGKQLVAAINRANGERNAVAHAAVEWDDQAWIDLVLSEPAPVDTNKLPLYFLREKNPGPKPVDEKRLFETYLDFSLLHAVALALFSDAARIASGEPTEVVPDLRLWILGWGVDPGYVGWPKAPEWESDVRRLFQLPRNVTSMGRPVRDSTDGSVR